VSFGEGKAALGVAQALTRGAWDTVAFPGSLFDKLIDPMVAGAIVSPDLSGGASTRLVGAINDVRQQYFSVLGVDVSGAESNFGLCPVEA